MIYTKDFEIDLTGKEIVTDKLQKIIDEAHLKKEELVISKGIYLTGPVFIHSDMIVTFEDGATLLGSHNEEDFKLIKTRVAGINLDWYPAIFNILEASNVEIRGNGIIDGDGTYYYNKYWGVDMQGGMRKEYDSKGLRFLCDYDCKRPRNILVQNSINIKLFDVTSKDSGFWNLHVLYSENIHINNVKIMSGLSHGPSTDGIDIDSSNNVLVENCITQCNDDSICVKSGRDSDGIKTNIPCHDIEIRNCTILNGFGITIGSEVSGGVYNINIHDIKFESTDCAFRIKSSLPRRGYIKDIKVDNLELTNVKYAFHLFLNWNPSYSICKLPQDFNGKITPTISKLIEEVDENIPLTIVDGIKISNVKSKITDDYQGISRAFNIEAYKEMPIKNLSFENIDLKCKEFGIINYAEVSFKNMKLDIIDKEDINNNVYDNR